MSLLRSWTKWGGGLQLSLALPEICQTLRAREEQSISKEGGLWKSQGAARNGKEEGWLAHLTFTGDTFCIL